MYMGVPTAYVYVCARVCVRMCAHNHTRTQWGTEVLLKPNKCLRALAFVIICSLYLIIPVVMACSVRELKYRLRPRSPSFRLPSAAMKMLWGLRSRCIIRRSCMCTMARHICMRAYACECVCVCVCACAPWHGISVCVHACVCM